MSKDLSEIEIIELELSKFSSNYYRDKFRLMVKVLLLMIVGSIILIGIATYLGLTRLADPYRFYASNTYTGRVEKIYPLSESVIKPEKLIKWSNQAVVTALTFNYVNYRDVFSEAQSFFTDKGWKNYSDALKNSGILDTVIGKNLFISAAINGQPKILGSGVVGGHYAWNLQIPVLLVYQTSEGRDNQEQQQMQKNILVNIVVMRVPNVDDPEDVAISSFSFSSTSS